MMMKRVIMTMLNEHLCDFDGDAIAAGSLPPLLSPQLMKSPVLFWKLRRRQLPLTSPRMSSPTLATPPCPQPAASRTCAPPLRRNAVDHIPISSTCVWRAVADEVTIPSLCFAIHCLAKTWCARLKTFQHFSPHGLPNTTCTSSVS